MTEKKKETVDDVMIEWNDHRAKEMESLAIGDEKSATISYTLLQTSLWMDRLYIASLRGDKPTTRKGRGPARPKDVVPNGGPKVVE